MFQGNLERYLFWPGRLFNPFKPHGRLFKRPFIMNQLWKEIPTVVMNDSAQIKCLCSSKEGYCNLWREESCNSHLLQCNNLRKKCTAWVAKWQTFFFCKNYYIRIYVGHFESLRIHLITLIVKINYFRSNEILLVRVFVFFYPE